MKITIFNDGEVRIYPSQENTTTGKLERSYVQKIIDSLLWVYQETVITTWTRGVKIVGKVKREE
ncbi:MAG: hypothetical protein V3U84_02740 [Thiotrichaceae bacterium]